MKSIKYVLVLILIFTNLCALLKATPTNKQVDLCIGHLGASDTTVDAILDKLSASILACDGNTEFRVVDISALEVVSQNTCEHAEGFSKLFSSQSEELGNLAQKICHDAARIMALPARERDATIPEALHWLRQNSPSSHGAVLIIDPLTQLRTQSGVQIPNRALILANFGTSAFSIGGIPTGSNTRIRILLCDPTEAAIKLPAQAKAGLLKAFTCAGSTLGFQVVGAGFEVVASNCIQQLQTANALMMNDNATAAGKPAFDFFTTSIQTSDTLISGTDLMSIATSHRIDKLPGELSDKVAIALGWDANGRVDLDLHVAYTESDPAHPRFAYFARPVVSTEAANLSYDRDLQSYAELSGLCEVVRINSTSRTGKLKARFLVIRVHWYAGEATSANGHLRIFPNANDSEFVEVNIPQIRPGEWKEIVIPIM